LSHDVKVVLKLRRVRCVGHVALMGEKTNGCEVFVGKYEGKRLLKGRMCRWEGDISYVLITVYNANIYEGWRFNSDNTAVETPCNGTK
jgi:hypothetical protein